MSVQTFEQTMSTPISASSSDVLVMLCRDAENEDARLNLEEIAAWLSRRYDNLRVLIPDDPCHTSQGVKNALKDSDAQRLVLGLCSSPWPETEVQAIVRRAGMDPLSIQAVNIGICRDGADGSASAKARLLLTAAIAHARAFPGSRPENLKATLARGRQRISRRALFTLPPITYVSVPTISTKACAAETGCDQCVSACPHGALRRGDSFIRVERSKCQSCGACVEACPQRAVEFPGWSAEEFEAHLDALLRTDEGITGRAVLFVCGNDHAPVEGGWLPMRVPCVAMVPAAAVLRSLAAGAPAVGIRPCGPECPTSASEVLQERVDYCRKLLQALGDAPGRVVLGDAPPPAPLRALPTSQPDGSAPVVPPRLFGAGAAAYAVEALAASYPQATDVVMEHPCSPLGIVSINPDACTSCEACTHACPTGALCSRREEEHISIAFDPRLCIACGDCLPVCPEKKAGAIHLARITSVNELGRGTRVVLSDQEVRCRRCGTPVASRRMLTRIAEMLGEGSNLRGIDDLCSDCRGLPV